MEIIDSSNGPQYRVLHCTKCRTFVRHVFLEERAVNPTTLEEIYRCQKCATDRRFGLSTALH